MIHKAFDRVKEYLFNLPILVPPVSKRLLILYLAIHERSIGCVLRQHDETRKKEQAVYYLNKKFIDYEKLLKKYNFDEWNDDC